MLDDQEFVILLHHFTEGHCGRNDFQPVHYICKFNRVEIFQVVSFMQVQMVTGPEGSAITSATYAVVFHLQT